ncbi:NHL repeat protein [Planctomycetes bacterium Poly30]|uniref:NHL repeat protein n=1 Tax=Saltatorellus ferox TaxID=2528018 RepID=A0A518F0E9_9BACT|nr:NHL repeat protein [Planctomycetes bacterium Poly30]
MLHPRSPRCQSAEFQRPSLSPFEVLMASTMLLVASCSSSDDGGGGSGDVGAPVRTYVAETNSLEVSFILRGSADLTPNQQLISAASGGMAFDYLGNLYQASPPGALNGPSIKVLRQAARRSFGNEEGGFSGEFDHKIEGFATTLVEPRSVALAHGSGRILVADSGDSSVKVFAMTSGGEAPPIFQSTTPVPPWDLAYDEPSDRLYVTQADGSVAFFDQFLELRPASPSGSILPSLDGTTPLSTDLRGIALLAGPGGEVGLVVSDFGAEENGTDGSILVFDDVRTASGPVAPDQVMGGATAQLRGPVDLAVSADGYLRVVDGEARRVLIYPSSGAGRFQAAPSSTRSYFAPSAIALEPIDPVRNYLTASDLDSPAAPIVELVLGTSPSGVNGEVLRAPADLSGPPTAAFDPGKPLRGLGIDMLGTVYTSSIEDSFIGPVGATRAMNRLALERGTGMDVTYDPAFDRLIWIELLFSPAPTPVAPTALEIDDERGLLIVSDPGKPGIWTFGSNGGIWRAQDFPPNSDPLDLVEGGFAIGLAEPAMTDYDAGADSLYVAVSNGTIYCFEGFTGSTGTLPDRVINPADAQGLSQVSRNLSGLVHDVERDLLIVSDLGDDAGLGNDGAIFVIEGASQASGLTATVSRIAGASTGLDEPTGLAWDGSSLWVADRANGMVSRFDDLLSLDGDVAPTATLAVPDVSFVVLRAEGLAPTSGGSIGQ